MPDLTFSYVQDPIDALASRYGDFNLNYGYKAFLTVSAIVLIWELMKKGFAPEGLLNFFVKYGLRFVFVNAVYTFYYAPLAFGLSLHELPSAVCTFLARRMDMGVLDVMYNQLAGFMNQSGGVFEFGIKLRIGAAIGETAIVFFQAWCWWAMIVSYGMVGVITGVLPLLLWMLMVPALAHIPRNAIHALWENAFLRVVASAVVFCAATSVSSFLADTFHGQYDVDTFTAVAPKMIGLMFAWVLIGMRAGTANSDIFKGTASASTNAIGAAASMKRGMFH
ncbi:MAG: hypothetical protein ACJ73N_16305 [Bryobacteraceae bacterium]